MTHNDYAAFVEEILNEMMKLIKNHKITIPDLERAIDFHGKNFNRYTSQYNSPTRCLAYALRYGIKTSYQTWLNLKDHTEFKEHNRVVLLGGGCAFELLTFMKITRAKNLDVTVIDKYAADWEIFVPLIKNIAEGLGVKLEIRYVAAEKNLVDQIYSGRPEFIIASNFFSEIGWDKVHQLKLVFDRIPYLVQHLHYTHLDTLLNRQVFMTKLEPFPFIKVPVELAHMNLFGNFDRKMYYHSRNLIIWTQYAPARIS